MVKRITRRKFLSVSLILTAGLGMTFRHAKMQDATPEPEGTPAATQATTIEPTGAIRPVHDPCIIKDTDNYYVLCTGSGIPIRESPDLIDWSNSFPGSIFSSMPDWASKAIPNQPDVWAPDISYYNDKFHVYYAVSTFGKNRSVIGLVTNKTLHSKNEGYGWVDEGMVIESTEENDYNCIDPNLIIDADGVPWLAFGSFWTGIKMRQLDYNTGKLSDKDTTLYSLAQRFENYDAIEGAFIIRKGAYYYLFVSFDFCCKGVKSNYHVMVGRSEKVTGPYVDRDGTEMLQGGGTQVTFPTDRWRGPGHNGILQENGVEYIVYHAYDANNGGIPTLRINQLNWDADGWPSINTGS